MQNIEEKNLQKLARTLNVSIKQLSGEEPINTDHQRSKHRLSAQISAAALFGYDILEHRYGLTKDEVIEAAPMLFEALNPIFLQKRQEKLSAVRKLASTIEAIVPNPMNHALVFDGHVPGWDADGWGVEASLNFELSEIDRSFPFTESGWSVIQGRQVRLPLDAAIVPAVPRQRGAAATARLGL